MAVAVAINTERDNKMKKILALGAIVAAVAFQGCEKKAEDPAAKAADAAKATAQQAADKAAEKAPAAPAAKK
jgi:hypothetical protein